MLMSIIHANSFESKQFSTYFFLSNSTCPLYESFCSLFLPTSLSLSHFLYLLACLLFLSMFSVLDVAFPFKCCITSFRNLIPRRSAFNGILHHLFISFFLESDSQTFCFFFLFFLNCCWSIVVSTFPQPSPPPTFDPTPLWLCPWVLHTCSLTTVPLFRSIILSHLPSDYCQFVLYLNVSGSVLLACFVD